MVLKSITVSYVELRLFTWMCITNAHSNKDILMWHNPACVHVSFMFNKAGKAELSVEKDI